MPAFRSTILLRIPNNLSPAKIVLARLAAHSSRTSYGSILRLNYVRENASIAYSSASQAQFNALAQLAGMELIPHVNSIAVPPNVLVPFRDYLDTFRVDWAQSERSRWFLRAATDSYTTHNALVQQATLPSTGATTHHSCRSRS